MFFRDFRPPFLGAAGFGLAALTACVSPVPDVQSETRILRGRLSETGIVSGAGLTAEANAADWWRVLNDPALDTFVDYAAASSLDAERALLRLDEARGALRATRGSLFPTIGLDLSSEDATLGGGATEAGFSATWSLDVFGRARQSVLAAKARVGAADASAEDVRRVVIAGVVTTYLNLRAAEAERASLEASEKRLETGLQKIKRLTDAGFATSLDVERSRRQWHESRARLADLDARLIAFRNGLSLLLGEPPGRLALDASALAAPVPEPDLGAPDIAALLEHRPDIRAAAFELDAAAAEARAARRTLYPDLSVSAKTFETDLGRGALDFAGLESELIARAAAPLLFRGRQLGAIDIADARLKDAALAYEQTLLTALSEADTALAQTRAYRTARSEAAFATEAARAALTQSQRLFSAGEVGYLDVLFAEESLLEAERAERAAERNAALSWARYMSALSAF